MTIAITGGAGFIGSNFVLDWMARYDEPVVVLDKLTYAGNLASLATVVDDPAFVFERGDIADADFVTSVINRHRPRALLNFAAESHVDRSIDAPTEFVKTNVMGTFVLLESAREYWCRLEGSEKRNFRFLHVSTDEVYGALTAEAQPFAESHKYQPNSPYSATKAASDHLVRAWFQIYGFPVLTTNCSNNYGSYQFPEKLIPLMILNALKGKPLPLYGDGQHVRDWLYVEDHCSAIRAVLAGGRLGETYNVGGWNEKKNLDVVETICELLDALRPRSDKMSYKDQIVFVPDRLGHDRRYAIDARKIQNELGWRPLETFDSGIRKTVAWYLENDQWVSDVTSGAYREWVDKRYGV